ncbi:MAG: phosphoribosylformylglycinamidine synthase subunit PurS [Clostridiales bacterium]|jgi:phosphoribosylformylglycinamidine synthase|nr:phosphoribosylformylglycinamidine synthase subunit PurS [Clostridiales bacterium]
MQKAKVYVTLRESILDPQGKAVTTGLHKLGFDEVQNVRIGKFIEITMDGGDESRVTEMCEKLLANYVMEDFRIEMEPGK